MLPKQLYLAGLILVLLMQASPVPLRALELGPVGLVPAALPAGSNPVLLPNTADFNSDGIPERLLLAGGRLTIVSAERSVWQSPAGWVVAQAGIADLNRDGHPEAVLLVWRAFSPWPVDQWLPYGGRITGFHTAAGDSCHIILIGWRGREYGEMWAGSALAEPVRSFAVADLQDDGRQELLTLEGSYSDPAPSPDAPQDSLPAHALKVWEWNGFGFSAVSTVVGLFHKMALVQANSGRILILVP